MQEFYVRIRSIDEDKTQVQWLPQNNYARCDIYHNIYIFEEFHDVFLNIHIIVSPILVSPINYKQIIIPYQGTFQIQIHSQRLFKISFSRNDSRPGSNKNFNNINTEYLGAPSRSIERINSALEIRRSSRLGPDHTLRNTFVLFVRRRRMARPSPLPVDTGADPRSI